MGRIASQVVLGTRTQYPSTRLADLYASLTMPSDLVNAHQTLDKVVDSANGRTNFKTESEQVAFLFERCQQLNAPLVGGEKKGKKKSLNLKTAFTHATPLRTQRKSKLYLNNCFFEVKFSLIVLLTSVK